MKKIILSVAFLATMANSQAQETTNTTDKVTFGVKAGVNVSSAKFDENIKDYVSNIGNVVGANVGIYTNIPLGSKFAFQPEVLYSMQGFTYTFTNEYLKSEIETKLNYLNIPLNFQLTVIDKVFIEAGPNLDFLVNAKGSYTSTDKNTGVITTVDNQDLKDNYKSLVLGVNFGAGYKINNHVSANIRYGLGLSPANQGNTESSKNRLIQIGAAYSF